MKIISKYKDFYDYIVQDHDSDLIYVRKMDIYNKRLYDLYDSNKLYYPYYKFYYKTFEDGDVIFDNYVFGIYPYVYSQPVMKVFLRSLTNIHNTYTILLNKNDVEYVLNTNDASCLLNKAQTILNENYDSRIHKIVKANICSRNIIKSLTDISWKKECPQVFVKLNAPVFVEYYYELFEGGCYNENILANKLEEKHYITNISFSKLNINILKYWYDELNTVNTYNNIENFLWSVKQEPEANPDNKTKIIAHGFDLKTSFRKM